MEKMKTLRTVPLADVRIQDDFWDHYTGLVRSVAIPYQWDALNDRIPDAERSGCIHNFRVAAGLEKGDFYGMVFQDSDLSKFLEAVAYSLTDHPDAELEKEADSVIDIMEKAQRSDGYLDTYYLVKEKGAEWTNLCECHEMYCAGHMIEAGVAYYQATGKRKLLDIVCRFADLIDSKFGPEPEKLKGYPGHEELELALVKLYRLTGNERYLKLSKYFIDERGRQPLYFDLEQQRRGGVRHWREFDRFGRGYAQTQAPVREQTSAEGHSVRMLYLLSGMADVAAETNDAELLEACRRLWKSITQRRMYVTGGLGSSDFNEGFTFDYDLPNDTVYAETCASVAMVFFMQRMLQAEPKSCYADVMELELYNTLLASMSQDGKHFYYVNPLEVQPEASEKDPRKEHVKPVRQKWFACACCPPNLARLLMSLGIYLYSVGDDSLYVHLYIGSSMKTSLGGKEITVRQSGDYAYEGRSRLELGMEGSAKFTLRLRIPSWCSDAEILVNGGKVSADLSDGTGYAALERVWKDGDVVELTFPQTVQLLRCNPRVKENIGKGAVRRGPIVYCLEEADNGKELHCLKLAKEPAFRCGRSPELAGNPVVVRADGSRIPDDWGGDLYRADAQLRRTEQELVFVPYYQWGARGEGEMSVWVSTEESD